MRLEEAALTSPCLLTDKVAEAQQECLCLPRTPHRAAGLGAGQWEGSSDRNVDLCLSFSWGLGAGLGGSPLTCVQVQAAASQLWTASALCPGIFHG